MWDMAISFSMLSPSNPELTDQDPKGMKIQGKRTQIILKHLVVNAVLSPCTAGSPYNPRAATIVVMLA